MTQENGWQEYKRLVLADIQRLEDKINELGNKLDHLMTEWAAFQGGQQSKGRLSAIIITPIISALVSGLSFFLLNKFK